MNVANINNKDVCEDWIYDIFTEYIETPNNKDNSREILGFFNGALLVARWYFNSNKVEFILLNSLFYKVNNVIRKQLWDLLKATNDDENASVRCVMTDEKPNHVILTFFFKD